MFQYKHLLRNYVVTSAYHRRAQSILQKPLHHRGARVKARNKRQTAVTNRMRYVNNGRQ